MIYFRQGIEGARMIERCTANPLEWIKSSTQAVTGHPSHYKRSRAIYFISGKMKAEGGSVRRTNDNVIERDLVALDIDSAGASHRKATDHISELGYEALLFPTPSYTPDHERFRIVFPLSRPISDPEEYAATITQLANTLRIDADPCGSVWSQMQGAPITKSCAFALIHLEGIPVTPQPPRRPPKVPKYYYRQWMDALMHSDASQSLPRRIEHSKAVEIVKRYVDRNSGKLESREAYLSALMHLIKATHLGEIDEATGTICAGVLAGCHQEWEEENMRHFRRELRITKPRVRMTFMEKFGHE